MRAVSPQQSWGSCLSEFAPSMKACPGGIWEMLCFSARKPGFMGKESLFVHELGQTQYRMSPGKDGTTSSMEPACPPDLGWWRTQRDQDHLRAGVGKPSGRTPAWLDAGLLGPRDKETPGRRVWELSAGSLPDD